MFTPDNITELKENEIFVFGSNRAGNHAGGAARLAVEKFGAIMGQGEGLQGQSYAFPTLDENMRKINKDELVRAFESLCDCANDNPNKIFYLTKVGCGIAGFTEDEIIEAINKVDLPNNIIIPEDFNVVYSYKAFDENLQCRGFQYEVGKEYEESDAVACQKGFHACKNPFDVLNYYPLIDDNGHSARFAQVEQSGKIDNNEKDKTCSSKIKIKAELGFPGFINACVEWIKEYTSPQKIKSNNSGYSAQIGSSGDYAQIGSSGDYAQIGSSGYSAKIGSSGDSAKIGSSGDYAKIQSTGEKTVVMCAGYNSIASAKKGSWITLAEWKNNEEINRRIPVSVKTEYVDGKRIKEDVLYMLKNGKFIEVKK